MFKDLFSTISKAKGRKVHPLASAMILLGLAAVSGISIYAAKVHEAEKEMEILRRQTERELETSDRIQRLLKNSVK